MNDPSKDQVTLEKTLSGAAEVPQWSVYQVAILMGLTRTGKHVYAGTVPQATIDKRRKANRVARNSRKKNRK